MKINFLEFFKTIYKEDYKYFTRLECPIHLLDEKTRENSVQIDNTRYRKMRNKLRDLENYRSLSECASHYLIWNIQYHSLIICDMFSDVKNSFKILGNEFEVNFCKILLNFFENIKTLVYFFNELKRRLEA